VIEFIQNCTEKYDVINIEQKAFVNKNIFIVKCDLNEGFNLRMVSLSGKQNLPVYVRTSWQWCLWNRERFQDVMRSDIDTNAHEDLNWLRKVALEYPKTQAWIKDKCLHEYHFEDPTLSTCQ
jgi:hypothetical protein